MSRRKPDFFDELAAKIMTTIGDQRMDAERRKTAAEYVKLTLKLAHNQGMRDANDEARGGPTKS